MFWMQIRGTLLPSLFLAFALSGVPKLAYAGQLLLIGDSHLQGFYGQSLQNELEEARHTVRRISGCGISAVHLLYPVPVPCDAAANDSKQVQFINRDRSMPDLTEAARDSDLVVIHLGTNQYLSRNLKQYVTDIAAKIRAAGARCQWVGPPDLGTEELRTQARAVDAALRKETEQAGCTYISSLAFTRYPTEKALDGIHYPKSEAGIWAHAVAERIKTRELGRSPAAEPLRERPVTLQISTAMYLRGDGPHAPERVAPKGTKLWLSRSFAREHFGKEEASLPMVQDLIRNPERYGIKKERIYVPSTRRFESHYMIPVEYTDARGKEVQGFMALNFAEKLAKLQYPVAPPALVAPRIELPEAIQECEREIAESGIALGAVDNIREIASQLEDGEKPSQNLWAEYEDFARRFYRTYGHKARQSMDPAWAARELRAQYLKALIEEFGQEKASLMLAAVTAWGEAGNRQGRNDQLADLAAVLKVIENRAATKFSSNRGAESLLASLGIPKSQQNERLKAILAHLQFSVWNIFNLPKKDEVNPSLVRILGFNPDGKYRASTEKMRLAFEAQEKIVSGKIRLLGAFGDLNVRHYLANYFESRTSWAYKNPEKKILAPIVRITQDDGTERDVNLDSFRNPKHLFYGGLR